MAQVILEIPGLPGEANVEVLPDSMGAGFILCETLSHDIETEIEMTANGRRTVHIPRINNFSLARKWDASSSHIIKRMLVSKVDTEEWKIHCLKGLGEEETQQKVFLTVYLRKPIFSKYSLEVNEGDTTENLEINAVEVMWEYQQHDDANAPKGQHAVTFNSLTGKVT